MGLFYFILFLAILIANILCWKNDLHNSSTLVLNGLLLFMLAGRASFFVISIFGISYIIRIFIPMVITGIFYFTGIWACDFWYSHFCSNCHVSFRRNLIRVLSLVVLVLFFCSLGILVFDDYRVEVIYAVDGILAGLDIILLTIYFFHARIVIYPNVTTPLKDIGKVIHYTLLLVGICILLQILLWFICTFYILDVQDLSSLTFYSLFILVDVLCAGVLYFLSQKIGQFMFLSQSNSLSESRPLIQDEEEIQGQAELIHKRKWRRIKTVFVIIFLVLVGFGLFIFFLYPRYPYATFQNS